MATRQGMRRALAILAIGVFLGFGGSAARAQTTLYGESFDDGAAAGRWVTFNSGDATANFAYDYSVRGIPSAPNSSGGSTVGLHLTVNNTTGAAHAVSAYPAGLSLSGDYILKYDMWLNYCGGAGGGSGSTQYMLAGINHTPTQVHWPNNAATDGYSFAVDGEGGAAEDYRAYTGPTMVTTAGGVYLCSSQASTHPYYQALFPSPTYETVGSPGKHWVQVEISQRGGAVKWWLNGTLIAIRSGTAYTSGDILIGYYDPYASIAVPPADNFIVYDNVRVQTFPPVDCNTNGTADSAELAAGTSLDCNSTGVLDECETIEDCDFDADGDVDLEDVAGFVDCLAGPGALPQPTTPACGSACIDGFDTDGDTDVDLRDFAAIQRLLRPSPIPSRSPSAITGSQFIAQVVGLAQTAREPITQAQILAGNLPIFLRHFVPVTVTATIGGQQHTATYYVMPDYLCIGSNDDFTRIPMTPTVAQTIANAFGCLLPTRKMVNDIWSAATVKLAPSPISPTYSDITAVAVFYQHNLTIEGQRAGHPLGPLVGGIKKDVVITPLLASNPGKVAIYGWHYLSGTPIQPLYLGHAQSHVDYSHGIRLVKNAMLLDGEETTVAAVLADPSFCVLLSDEGVITNPSY